MSKKRSVSFLLGALCFSPALALADAIHIIDSDSYTQTEDMTATGNTNVIQSNGTRFSYTNTDKTISSEFGYGIHLNGIDPLPNTYITNGGNILVTGTGLNAGWGIYATVYQGRPISAIINNTGTIDRIQLQETNASSITNSGTINGTVLMGTNSNIFNTGTFANKTTGADNDNIISMGKNSVFNNGAISRDVLFVETDESGKETKSYYDVMGTTGTLTTDYIRFTQNGTFENSGTVQNKSFTFDDNGTLHNYMSGYDGGEEHSFVRTITTDDITMGNNAIIYNEMGGVIDVSNNITVGDNSVITNGGDYTLNLKPPKTTITKTDEDGKTETSEVENPTNMKQSTMNAQNITLGETSTLANLNGAVLNAQTITFQNNSTFQNQGGEVTLTAPAATDDVPEPKSTMTFKDNGTFTSASMTKTENNLNDKGEIETVNSLLNAQTTVDELEMGNSSSISLTGANLNIDNLTMGDSAVISGSSYTYTDNNGESYEIYGAITALGNINVGDNSTISSIGLNISANEINFKDGGTFTNSSSVTAKALNMGENSTINNAYVLNVPTTLGSHSVVNLSSGSDDINCTVFGACQGGSIIGNLKKAEGASNVQVISAVDENYYGYLSGIIDVDSIYVQQNSLRLSGDIKGTIGMDSNTVLKFVGESVYIHDPILRVSGAINTTLEIALDDTLPGERPFYETTNTVDVDHVLISSGGFVISRVVNVGDITLDSNAILKLKGNYLTGDIKEKDDEAVNTTFAIDVGTGNQFDTSGTITLDRVVVESGVFNVYHNLTAIEGKVAGIQQEGLELGTDSVANIYAQVHVNQIVRQSDALAPVTNTSVVVQNLLTVDKDMDVDHLTLDNGHLKFLNKNQTNKVAVTNDVFVGEGSILEGNGMFEVSNGNLTIGKGGLLTVSQDKTSETDLKILNIMSDLIMQTGSTFDLRATTIDSDHIAVAGTLDIGDQTRLILRNVEAGVEYDILSADTINGSADHFLVSFLWDNPIFREESNHIYVKVDQLKTLEEGISPTNPNSNVLKIAKALDEINASVTTDDKKPAFLESAIYAGDASEAAQIIRSLSPEGYGASSLVALRTLSGVNRNTQSVLAEIREASNKFIQPRDLYSGRSGGDFYYRHGDKWVPYSYDSVSQASSQTSYRSNAGGIWVKPYASKIKQDDVDGISGYDYDSYGITAGFDVASDFFSIGLMGIFGQGDLKQNDKLLKTDVDTYGVGIYGTSLTETGNHFFDFYAAWMMNSNKTTRTIASVGEKAKADYDTTTYSGGLSYGYNFEIGKHVVLIPEIGVNYAYIDTDNFKEKGSSAALNVKNKSFQSIQTPVELTAVFNFGNEDVLFSPELKARWAHEFGDVEASTKGSFLNYAPSFTVNGLEADRDNFTLGAGATLTFDGQSQLYFKYDYDFSSSLTGHTFNLGYSYAF